MPGTIAQAEETIRKMAELSTGQANFACRLDQIPELGGLTYEQILAQVRRGTSRIQKFAFEYSAACMNVIATPGESRAMSALLFLPYIAILGCLLMAVITGAWALLVAIPLFFVGQFAGRGVRGAIILTGIIAALTVASGVRNETVRYGLPIATLLMSLPVALLRSLYHRVLFRRAFESETLFAFLFSARQIGLNVNGTLIYRLPREGAA